VNSSDSGDPSWSDGEESDIVRARTRPGPFSRKGVSDISLLPFGGRGVQRVRSSGRCRERGVPGSGLDKRFGRQLVRGRRAGTVAD
jgi:hypothetical protein